MLRAMIPRAKSIVRILTLGLDQKEILFSLTSAILLTLSFPKTEIWFLAWGALIPLFIILNGQLPGRAFRIGFFFGLLFFVGTLHWFFHLMSWFSAIAVLGVILLLCYCSLYMGIFAWGVSRLRHKHFFVKFLAYPSLWVVLEFLRARLLSGFGWVNLGHTQYKFLSVIQIADLTGVFGISFIMVMVNYCLSIVVLSGRKEYKETGRVSVVLAVIMTMGLCAGVLLYGRKQLSVQYPSTKLRIAVVQPNIPQEDKWDERAVIRILRKMKDLSLQAPRNVDMLIWPETSFPGILWEDKDWFGDVQVTAYQNNVPLLLGSVIHEGDDYYNSALLLDARGEFLTDYHKNHLVPFGEYLPLRKTFPWLKTIIPLEDFTAGKEKNPFILPGKGANESFGVLICFEDTVEYMSRMFTLNGAKWLVNITNDAWFKDSIAPYLHLQAAVFRTVENRRALVRAANTGVSAVIDTTGRIRSTVKDGKGKQTYVEGILSDEVQMSDRITFYTRFGDIFAYLCAGFLMFSIMAPRSRV